MLSAKSPPQPLSRPRMSLVVIVYDMPREAPRTLLSLTPGYQRDVTVDDYEVLVVDNGSPTPLGQDVVQRFGPNFRYHYIADALPSPASAINVGVALTEGEIVGILIDGARMVTPGLLSYALRAFRMYDSPTVATHGWHLGPDVQMRSIAQGYTKAVEDQLLVDIHWPQEGYRLFEISCLSGSSHRGYFYEMPESNALFLTRQHFKQLGGYDPAFDLPGGGLVNLDFYRRVCEQLSAPVVTLLGEGTFHQLHGGISTNVPEEENVRRVREWAAQYKAIRGIPWQRPHYTSEYFGLVPPQALKDLAWSAEHRLRSTS